jgi:hypothetical protein
MAAPVYAADLQFTGAYRVRFQFDQGSPCLSRVDVSVSSAETACDGNDFQTRFRPRFTVETEGGVRAVLWLEIGDVRFGRGAVGGGHGADGINVETKNAYIDFPVPATPLRLRAGIQGLFFSKALFFDDDVSALSLYGKLGEINANAWWARINRAGTASGRFNDQLASGVSGVGGGTAGIDVNANGADARDLYAIDLSFSPVRDLNLNAYFLYDHDSESAVGTPAEASVGTWFGVGATGKVQNIRYDFDFVYGTKETPHPIAATKVDQKGWVIDGGVGMALPGTPLDIEARGWYATGWDGTTTGDIDAFPVLYGGSGGHEPGTQVWGGGGVIDIDALADNPQNTWGAGLIVRYTASPALKLTGNVHYIGTQEEGTAAVPSPAGDGFIYGVDSVGVEFGVRVDYTLYRGLVFTLTAGHLLIGDDTATNGDKFDDVTKIAGVLNYGF